MLYEEWKSRYKNLKNFNTVLQRCLRFWPLAPPRGMNPGVYSLGISEDPPRYLSSKFDASVRSDCWDISIWKTLTQCDGNGNANANENANADDRGDYNSSPCTSYRRAKNQLYLLKYPLFWTCGEEHQTAGPPILVVPNDNTMHLWHTILQNSQEEKWTLTPDQVELEAINPF